MANQSHPNRLLNRLQREGPVAVVPMGDVQFVSFQQIPAIAADQLDGCSVIIIASMYGAILGHIPPLPPNSTEEDLGHDNVRSLLGQAALLYNHYRAFFPVASSVIVCAWWRGDIGLPDQLEIMQQYFQQLGHTPYVRFYETPPDENRPGYGTVVVLSRLNQLPSVYVEDEEF